MTNIETIKEFASQVVAMDGLEIVNPVILDEITFVPIVKPGIPREDRDYLTLSEALEEGLCEIIEKGTEVAHILFKNKGNLPILIEEGEIFHGQGTQDRICISTMMIEPDNNIEIPVKCVHAPHHLSRGAQFGYGGKASRGMLKELRTMKYSQAVMHEEVSMIDQGQVWGQVHFENKVAAAPSATRYMEAVKGRQVKAKKRSKDITFPKDTIGVVVYDQEGDIKGVEIHKSPHNFEIRKDGILESLEASIDWKVKGKGPFQGAEEKTKNLFKKLSKLEEGKDIMNQVEVEGAVINMEGLKGEVFTTTFYSSNCPGCSQPKPRKKECPSCGFKEGDMDEMAYMSLY